MTDILLKDSTKMLEELSKPYGCYGVTSTVGFGEFIDQWYANNGPDGAMEGAVMVINTATGKFTMWRETIFDTK